MEPRVDGVGKGGRTFLLAPWSWLLSGSLVPLEYQESYGSGPHAWKYQRARLCGEACKAEL